MAQRWRLSPILYKFIYKFLSKYFWRSKFLLSFAFGIIAFCCLKKDLHGLIYISAIAGYLKIIFVTQIAYEVADARYTYVRFWAVSRSVLRWLRPRGRYLRTEMLSGMSFFQRMQNCQTFWNSWLYIGTGFPHIACAVCKCDTA